MRQILREYLSNLREREELDAILPDLLSSLGLVVFSTPARGTRQDGVDIAAFGNFEGHEDSVHLFSVKSGKLTRSEWDGASDQALRPSLNEVIDAFIPNRIPQEYVGKNVVIYICIGGEVSETVRPLLSGFQAQACRDNLLICELNGDRIASLILRGDLREQLLPGNYRSNLRKCLALLDEPYAAIKWFDKTVEEVRASCVDNSARLRGMGQLRMFLWIVYTWCRSEDNLELAYIVGERCSLACYAIVESFDRSDSHRVRKVERLCNSVEDLWLAVWRDFKTKVISPSEYVRDGLLHSVRASVALHGNLSAFETLGRIALRAAWHLSRSESGLNVECNTDAFLAHSSLIQGLVDNNRVLDLPVSESQAFNLGIALFVLHCDPSARDFLLQWLGRISNRYCYALSFSNGYPCVYLSVEDLLAHPLEGDDYFKGATNSSVLLPLLSIFSVLAGANASAEIFHAMHVDRLSHTTLQVWGCSVDELYDLLTGTAGNAIGAAFLINSLAPEDLFCFLASIVKGSLIPNGKDYRLRGDWFPYLLACKVWGLPFPVFLLEPFNCTSSRS